MIGLTSTTLRSYSIEETVEIAAKAGAEIIEWGSDKHIKSVQDAEKAKKLCGGNGIIINSYGTYYRIGSGDESGWKSICETSAAMGAKYIRTWLGTRGSRHTGEREYEKLLLDGVKTADIAAGYGLTVCNECHPNTFNDTTESSLKFLKDADRKNIRTYYQSWYRDEAADKEKLFRTFDFVQDVHVSFSELTRFQRFHKKDEKYIEKILSWLKELNFSGGIMIEFTKNGSAGNLIKDTERLKSLWERK